MWCIMIITEPKGDIKIVMAEQFRTFVIFLLSLPFAGDDCKQINEIQL